MIEINRLSFSYNSSPALKDVSLSIEDGEFVGVIGPTGSGKSTLMLCLNGLIPNSIKGSFEGYVKVNGLDTSREKVLNLAKHVGLVFQDPDSQIFSPTVEGEVAFGLRNLGFKGSELSARIEHALKEMGIENLKDRETHTLSFGQKQKLCIASVLAMGPKILVLDEPSAQLDHKSTEDLYSLLGRLNRNGTTVIVVEHKLDWLDEHAKRIIAIKDGSVVADGTPGRVLTPETLRKAGLGVPRLIILKKQLEDLHGKRFSEKG